MDRANGSAFNGLGSLSRPAHARGRDVINLFACTPRVPVHRSRTFGFNGPLSTRAVFRAYIATR